MRPQPHRYDGPRLIATGILATTLCVSMTFAGQPLDPAEAFRTQIAPALSRHCIACHGPETQESGLRVDRRAELMSGGDRGPALVPGKPLASWIYLAVAHAAADDDLQMPPEDKPPVPAELAEQLRDWIAQGAPWPEDLVLVAPRDSFSDADRKYWAFQPITDPTPPQSGLHWARNPIDQFVYSRLEAHQLPPAGQADRITLIRRLYFDLIGLPPSPQEVAHFVKDDEPQAYERLVDSLLERPEYGERWARHWLDLVRYAESDGFKADVYRPHAWRYRDYVIGSFNEDKPFDRFVQEQIAGDELFPSDMQARVATGYLRLWPLEDNQKDVQRQWRLVLEDVTEVTGEVFLATGLRCAKCHDHKYDPIPRQDYYRLEAFFAGMLPRDDLQVADASDAERLLAWEQVTRPIRRELAALERQYVASRTNAIAYYPLYLQAIYAKPFTDWAPYDKQLEYLARPQVYKRASGELKLPDKMQQRWDQLRAELKRFEQILPQTASPVPSVTDVGPVAAPTYVGNEPSGRQVTPGVLSILDPSDTLITPRITEPSSAVATSTGRRAALATWLTDPGNPLVPRVIVNRIWQQHFGRGIVETANDFGRQGTPPTHPELLDWLARRFIDDGWSLKSLHRRIVTSATYRQAPMRGMAGEMDPAERQRWLSGYPPRRLDSEQIRDAMLAAAGRLVVGHVGPSVSGDKPLRSIYVRQVRNQPDEWLSTFDGPDMFNSCARRYVTTTPLQALLVMNSPWALQRAEELTERVLRESANGPSGIPSLVACVNRAVSIVFTRPATDRDLAAAETFFTRSPTENGFVGELTDYCHTLMCSNEFLFIE